LEAELKQKTPESGAEPISIKLILIQDGTNMFRFLAIAQGKEVKSFNAAMDDVVDGFNRLTDREKLNRQVERVRIVSVKRNGTFAEVLADYKMPTARHKELAILNGMELTDRVTANMLVKVIKNLKPE
jgi:predicted Zn-dependent protease